MKVCGLCKEEKPLDCFGKNAGAKDGLQHRCKSCNSRGAKEWQKKNKKQHSDNRRAVAERNQTNLWNLLQMSECVDCKIKDPYVLQFDHKDQLTKTCNIATMTWSFSWARIQEEVDKCEVRCANCHQRKSAFQLGLWRSKMK